MAGAFSITTVLAYMEFMGQGIAAGALIGLPGREADIAIIRHQADVWLAVAAVFQFAVVIALFSLLSLLRFGSENDRVVRWTSRGAVATFLSFVTTLGIGMIAFETLSLFRFHLR